MSCLAAPCRTHDALGQEPEALRPGSHCREAALLVGAGALLGSAWTLSPSWIWAWPTVTTSSPSFSPEVISSTRRFEKPSVTLRIRRFQWGNSTGYAGDCAWLIEALPTALLPLVLPIYQTSIAPLARFSNNASGTPS